MPHWICLTCGVEYPEAELPPAHCPICEDERQYVGLTGQRWTRQDDLARDHRLDWRELEPGLSGIGVAPLVAIGQRMLFARGHGGNMLWDCIPLLDDAAAERLRREGVAAMAISHPHFYAAMVSWSERLGGVPIYLHEDDADHVMRPSPLVRFWSGERLEPVPGFTLLRCGGHFPGSQVLHWPEGAGGRGALFTGDTIQVAGDTRWVSFLYSYPNMIPLPERRVRAIAATVGALAFERLYGGWWERVVRADAHAAVQRSAERYVAALADERR